MEAKTPTQIETQKVKTGTYTIQDISKGRENQHVTYEKRKFPGHGRTVGDRADVGWNDTDWAVVVGGEPERGSSKERVANIIKHVWSRVYLNIYDGGDFDKPSELTLKAALMEFFLPTTKRKIQRNIANTNQIDWWSHWLGAGHSKLSKPKAALIVAIDIVFFLPRLAINIAKLFTEVLPDVIAQLFFLAYKKANIRRKSLEDRAEEIAADKEGGAVKVAPTKDDDLQREAQRIIAIREYKALAAAHKFAMGLAYIGAAIFKCIYFIGCCITSPITTGIRAGKFNYQSDKLNNLASFFSHFSPMVSFGCYMIILFLLANLIPGLGFVLTLSGVAVAGLMLAYVVAGHFLSYLNRSPNGDNLIDFPGSDYEKKVRDKMIYTDRDINYEKVKNFSSTEPKVKIYHEVKLGIQETLKYEHLNDFHAPVFSAASKGDDTCSQPLNHQLLDPHN